MLLSYCLLKCIWLVKLIGWLYVYKAISNLTSNLHAERTNWKAIIVATHYKSAVVQHVLYQIMVKWCMS